MEIINITEELMHDCNLSIKIELSHFLVETGLHDIIESQKNDEEKAKIIYEKLNEGFVQTSNIYLNTKCEEDHEIDARIEAELAQNTYKSDCVLDDEESDEEENNEEFIDSMILCINDGDVISRIYDTIYKTD